MFPVTVSLLQEQSRPLFAIFAVIKYLQGLTGQPRANPYASRETAVQVSRPGGSRGSLQGSRPVPRPERARWSLGPCWQKGGQGQQWPDSSPPPGLHGGQEQLA